MMGSIITDVKENDSRRLSPLLNFMLEEGVGVQELADRMGISSSSINRCLNMDDAKLSILQEAAGCMGGHIEWKIVKD